MLGDRIATLRKINKLSQYELADRLGFSRGKLANYEQGSRQPDYETLQKLADFFDVTTDYLLGRTDNPDLKRTANNNKYDSLDELNKLIKEFGIEDSGFFDIDQWKNLSPEDIDEVKRHFEWIAHKAKERKKEEN